MSGLQSALTIRSSSVAARDSARSTEASLSRSTAASPRNSPSSVWVSRSSIISAASRSSIGTSRKATSATASARMPPTPSITVIPNCGSRWSPAISSRLPDTIGATSRWTAPSSGRAAARRSVAAARTASSSPRPRRTRPRSVLCAIESPPSLTTTGWPSSSAAATAASTESTTFSATTGSPWDARRALESASDSVGTPGNRTHWRTRRYHGSRAERKNSRMWSRRRSMRSAASGSSPRRPSMKGRSEK